VTVEAVSVTKDGIHKLKNEEDEDGADSDSVPNAGAGEESDQKVAKPQVKRDANGKRIWTKENPKKGQVKPKKKKKFRYESKAERKVTRMKERSGNRRQAEERKNK
jgi:ribosomal RNA-processing protein 17